MRSNNRGADPRQRHGSSQYPELSIFSVTFPYLPSAWNDKRDA